ncbi:MAG: WD40/YVTN/BNR-like repeat-containing protein, partial [Terriglobia bacterium]
RGASWEPLMRGLPQKGAYETVLRDALTADSLDPAGIYFGTRSGQLFASRDEGKTWQKILDGLPSIVCVRSAVIEDAQAASAATSLGASVAASTRSKSRATTKSRRTKIKKR